MRAIFASIAAVSIGLLSSSEGQARPTNYEQCMAECVPTNDEAIERKLTEEQLDQIVSSCDLGCDPVAITFGGGPVTNSSTSLALFDDLTHFSYEFTAPVTLYNNFGSLARASQGSSFVTTYGGSGQLITLATPTRFVGFVFNGGPRQAFERASLVLYDEQQNVLEFSMLLDTPYDVLADLQFFDQGNPFLGIETDSPVKYVRTFEMQIYPLPEAVPEPSTILLLATGCSGLIAVRYARRTRF